MRRGSCAGIPAAQFSTPFEGAIRHRPSHTSAGSDINVDYDEITFVTYAAYHKLRVKQDDDLKNALDQMYDAKPNSEDLWTQ